MEQSILKLDNPIFINGKQRREFVCKPDEITVDQFDKIDALCAASRKPNDIVMAEVDNTRYRYIAMFAIIAADPEIDIEDLRRIKGVNDSEKLRVLGRNFTMETLEEVSEESTSEEPQENIAAPSM